MLRRYRIVRALLLAGVILGFGHGFMTVAHKHRECRRQAQIERCADPPPSR